jgi:hypothetical protein
MKPPLASIPLQAHNSFKSALLSCAKSCVELPPLCAYNGIGANRGFVSKKQGQRGKVQKNGGKNGVIVVSRDKNAIVRYFFCHFEGLHVLLFILLQNTRI